MNTKRSNEVQTGNETKNQGIEIAKISWKDGCYSSKQSSSRRAPDGPTTIEMAADETKLKD